MSSDIEYLSSAYLPCIPLGWRVCSEFLSIFKNWVVPFLCFVFGGEGVVSFIIELWKFFIWWIQVLYQMYCFAIIFVLSAAWLFTLHGLFQRPRGLNFDEVLFINLLLCGFCLLVLCLRRLCLTQSHRGFLHFFQKFSALQFHI